jgi:hypothetical protein
VLRQYHFHRVKTHLQINYITHKRDSAAFSLLFARRKQMLLRVDRGGGARWDVAGTVTKQLFAVPPRLNGPWQRFALPISRCAPVTDRDV